MRELGNDGTYEEKKHPEYSIDNLKIMLIAVTNAISNHLNIEMASDEMKKILAERSHSNTNKDTNTKEKRENNEG